MVRHLLRIVIGGVISLSCAPWVHAAERSPSRPDVTRIVLTVAMVGECGASEAAVTLAQKESARVWSRADVIVRWVQASEVSYTSPLSSWLLVRCAEGPVSLSDSEPSHAMPIAAIRFIDSRPTNTMLLNLENADILLRREATDFRGAGAWFIPFRDIRLGRMLGRAIAHEIGHFLSQSGAHTRTGLMRASHTLAALTGTSLAAFSVDEAQTRALRAGRGSVNPGS